MGSNAEKQDEPTMRGDERGGGFCEIGGRRRSGTRRVVHRDEEVVSRGSANWIEPDFRTNSLGRGGTDSRGGARGAGVRNVHTQTHVQKNRIL